MTKDYSIFNWESLSLIVDRYYPTLCGYSDDYEFFIIIKQIRENGPIVGYILHPTENKLLKKWYLNRTDLEKYKARIGIEKL